MRVGPKEALHLSYCTNVHRGESFAELWAALRAFALPLKARVSPHAPFGLGLRLGNRAARDLEPQLDRFAAWLRKWDLYVATLNGFPYGEFHRAAVKERVFAPAWSTPARLEYTVRMARIAAELARSGTEIGISTVPVGYGLGHAGDAVWSAAAQNLAELSWHLHRLRLRLGVVVHVDLEPEPDGALEHSAHVVDFFERWLLPRGVSCLRHKGVSAPEAEAILRKHIRVCLDACHSSVVFEGPRRAIAAYAAAGISIGKLQVSAALAFQIEGGGNPDLRSQLEPFADPIYLHQVAIRNKNKPIKRFPDLPPALDAMGMSSGQWRVHYHVPLFMDEVGSLGSTRDETRQAIERVLETGATRQLEIETYTWDVLPTSLRVPIVESLEREYEWTIDCIRAWTRQRMSA